MSEPTSAVTEPRRPRGPARQAWLQRLTRFADSGQTPAQFCAAEGVSLPCFYAWRRRLAATPQAAGHRDAGRQTRLLPVCLAVADAPIEIVLSTGALVRLRPGCDLAFVRSLVQTLGETPC